VAWSNSPTAGAPTSPSEFQGSLPAGPGIQVVLDATGRVISSGARSGTVPAGGSVLQGIGPAARCCLPATTDRVRRLCPREPGCATGRAHPYADHRSAAAS
jgi:hypothetical protein